MCYCVRKYVPHLIQMSCSYRQTRITAFALVSRLALCALQLRENLVRKFNEIQKKIIVIQLIYLHAIQTGGTLHNQRGEGKQKASEKVMKKCCLANRRYWESSTVVCLLSVCYLLCCPSVICSVCCLLLVMCSIGYVCYKLGLWLINYCGMYTLKLPFCFSKKPSLY